MTIEQLLPYLSSLAIGLLIGFERERSHRAGAKQAAGSRTFALLALCGTLAERVSPWAVVAGVAVVGTLAALGYRRTSGDDAGTTTEVAELTTFLLGALAFDQAALAAGVAIVFVVLLSSKELIHSFVREVVTDTEVEDALKFLVVAFVVYPLLPDRDLGPYGVLNPAHIWRLVVLLTGVSWAGYIAVRILGPRRGLLVTGLAGGFVSASATTASMARLHRDGTPLPAAVAGAQLASVATFVQLVAVLGVVSSEVAARLWPAAGAATVVLSGIAWAGQRRTPAATGPDARPGGRPFALRPALVLTGLLTAALLVGRAGAEALGSSGAVLAAGAAGLADAHAGALAATTLHESGQLDLATSLLAIVAALGTNTVVKGVLAFSAGGRAFGLRFLAGVLPAMLIFGGVLATTGRG